MWILLLVTACQPEPEDWLVEDSGFRGTPTLEEVSADCHEGHVRVRARLHGWGRDAAAEVWDGLGGYARISEGFGTTGFSRDRTCDVLEASTGDTGDTGTDPALAPCTSMDGYTVRLYVWSEVGCAGVVTWGAEAEAVTNGTIQPPAMESPDDECVPGDAEVVDYVGECVDG